MRQEPSDLLADLDHEDLVALLTMLLHEHPELHGWVESALVAPSTPGKRKKKHRKQVDVQAYRRQVVGILHSLDGMRASEAYWYVGGLAGQLREVQATASKFLDAGDPETALAILMTIVEEAGHGIEYIDDSDGYLGDFMGELGQPLAEAILSLDLSAVEREKLVSQLEKQAAYLADYGLEGGVELAIEAARSGWGTALTKPLARSRKRDDVEDDAAYQEDWEEGAIAGRGCFIPQTIWPRPG